jgi:nitrite reductase/ring-hydroxylating ferredoxin subunit
MLEQDAAAQPLCRADELAERGRAVVFDVLLWRQPARAFALRFDGRVVAYINRCAHVPTEMDWQPGEFLDAERRNIVCSIHGATYAPESGRCVGGPCGRGRLMALAVSERDGQVYWYPSRDIAPLAFDEPDAPALQPSTPS